MVLISFKIIKEKFL